MPGHQHDQVQITILKVDTLEPRGDLSRFVSEKQIIMKQRTSHA